MKSTKPVKHLVVGVREMEQWVRAMVALPKNRNLIPRIQRAAHNSLSLVPENMMFSQGFHGHQNTYIVYRYVWDQNTHTHKK